jgi:hypothetical protein
MVRQHPGEMAGVEVEEVAVHETAGEPIATGQSLHLGFIEAFAGCLF